MVSWKSLPFFGRESTTVFRLGICYRFSVGNLQSCHVAEKRLEFPVRKTGANPVRKRPVLNPIWRQACPVESITPHPDLAKSDDGKGLVIPNRKLVTFGHTSYIGVGWSRNKSLYGKHHRIAWNVSCNCPRRQVGSRKHIRKMDGVSKPKSYQNVKNG